LNGFYARRREAGWKSFVIPRRQCNVFARKPAKLVELFMKQLFIILFICIAIFSCKKQNSGTASPYQNIGVINGIDPCEYPCIINCPCACGDLFFHFTDSSYTANIPIDNPGIFNLPLNTKYPVYVKVNWQNTSRCSTTAIKITAWTRL
jgi:ubiquitin C-terminal hydrolase